VTARLLMAASAVSVALGCGGRCHVVAPHVAQPVSASASLFGPHGETLTAPDDLEIVAHFTHDVQRWALLWGLVPLGAERTDLSELLSEQLRTARGDGIVNLSVGKDDGDTLFNFLGFIPLVPTRVSGRIEGDVVRVRRREG